MSNPAMIESITNGTCIDVTRVGTYDPGEDVYVLATFDYDKDYCEVEKARWVWSIGRRRSDGAVLAAFDSRFYLHPDYVCLWLR